jgi:hypothetical protein
MQQVTVNERVDPFTIQLEPAASGATMVLAWGDRSWSVGLDPAS